MATPDDYDQTSLTRAVERLAQLGHAAALARAAYDRPDAFQARGHDPAEYPPLAREEALEQLALSEGVRQRLAHRRQVDVYDARVAGASWSEIGEALGVSKQAAHEAHTRWIAEQAGPVRPAGARDRPRDRAVPGRGRTGAWTRRRRPLIGSTLPEGDQSHR